MLLHETFLRCPKCDHPYFVKKKLILLNKAAYLKEEILQQESTINEYSCASCGFSLDRERVGD